MSSTKRPPGSQLLISADCEAAPESHSSTTGSEFQQENCKIVQELHRAVFSQMVHTEEALQDALHEKVCSLPSIAVLLSKAVCRPQLAVQEDLLQQMHTQEQLLAHCQQQLAAASLQLREQQLQQSLLSEQCATTIASLQFKVQAMPNHVWPIRFARVLQILMLMLLILRKNFSMHAVLLL